MAETSHPTHSTTLGCPPSVEDYFCALNRHTTEVKFRPGDLTTEITLVADDLYILADNVRTIERDLANTLGVQVSINRPEVNPNGFNSYEAKVPASDDVQRFFSHLTGLAAANFDPARPEQGVRVTFYEDDDYALAELVAEIDTLINADFLGEVQPLGRPTPVTDSLG